MDNIELLKSIYGPLERGESDDFQPFFDHLADDVVLKTTIGELRGKQAVVDYFVNAEEFVEFRPFERPLEYFGRGERVVIVGEETFKVKRSGVTVHRDWAWVYDLRDGLITRILGIEDLSGVEDAIGEAFSRAGAVSLK